MTTTRSKTSILRSHANSNSTLFEYPPSNDLLEPGRSVITFTKHDYKQLQPSKFLNDTIIYFFMQYHLDHEVGAEMKHRIHVFNSFFFAKIRSIHQRKNGSPPSYKFASRWLREISIFDKDFLIIPVCERDHWLLVIVCYPANLPSKDTHKIPDQELYEPAVIVMNSCRGLAPPIKKALGQFLNQQWKHERKSDRRFSIQNAKNKGIKLIFPELPQQKNNYDCGVYILGYFYSFLRDPRKAYIKILRQRSMRNWFLDNNIDISRERRRMTTFIKSRVSEWNTIYQKELDFNKNLEYDLQEIHIISSHSEESSINSVEEAERIISQKPEPSSLRASSSVTTRAGTTLKESGASTGSNRIIVIN